MKGQGHTLQIPVCPSKSANYGPKAQGSGQASLARCCRGRCCLRWHLGADLCAAISALVPEEQQPLCSSVPGTHHSRWSSSEGLRFPPHFSFSATLACLRRPTMKRALAFWQHLGPGEALTLQVPGQWGRGRSRSTRRCRRRCRHPPGYSHYTQRQPQLLGCSHTHTHARTCFTRHWTHTSQTNYLTTLSPKEAGDHFKCSSLLVSHIHATAW